MGFPFYRGGPPHKSLSPKGSFLRVLIHLFLYYGIDARVHSLVVLIVLTTLASQ